MDNAGLVGTNLEMQMSGGGWSCPHELGGLCSKVDDRPCDPGMKGCELHGRYAFFDDSKNERLRHKQARTPAPRSDTADSASEKPPPCAPLRTGG